MFTVKNTIFFLTILSALSCGIIAGVYYGFSTFVMKGLNRLPANEGIAAMQSINIAAVNSLFGATFVITPIFCLLAMILAIWKWESRQGKYIIAGALFYLIGSLLATIIFNLPLNDSLAGVVPADPNNSAVWRSFYDSWMVWNHVRTFFSLAASVSFVVALFC